MPFRRCSLGLLCSEHLLLCPLLRSRGRGWPRKRSDVRTPATHTSICLCQQSKERCPYSPLMWYNKKPHRGSDLSIVLYIMKSEKHVDIFYRYGIVSSFVFCSALMQIIFRPLRAHSCHSADFSTFFEWVVHECPIFCLSKLSFTNIVLNIFLQVCMLVCTSERPV